MPRTRQDNGGLCLDYAMATAHSSTARMRWRTVRDVGAFTCQIGPRTSIKSALVTSGTGIFPMRGKAYRFKLLSQIFGYFGSRQPACCCSTTLAAASAKVGTPAERRFSASGSPPSQAQLAVRPRLLSGLGQCDQCDATESEVTSPPTDDEALDPAPGSARLNVEVEPITVTVPARRGRTHECGRQGLVGMAALRLRFPGRVRGVYCVIHYLII